jgi:lipoate-protein ligase A
MVCFSNPTKYDLLLGERKVAGSAQRRTRDGILHQGSLHFGGPLPVAREEMAEALASGFVETMRLRFSPFVPDELLLTFAAALAEEKYAATAWNCKR